MAKAQKIEFLAHILFWVFFFTAVNVEWSQYWFDRSTRPNTPFPIAVLLFPVFFYLHAYWALPQYLYHRKFFRYGLSLIAIFLIPEFIRVVAYNYLGYSIVSELTSKDSLILGTPSVAWMAFITSLIYRFSKDWFAQKNMKEESFESITVGSVNPLQKKEADSLNKRLEEVMQTQSPHLDKNLSLRMLAKRLDTTDKKLSTLLNQNLNTGFADYINEKRIHHFLDQVSEGALNQFTIIGLARQCGFSSKTSFYRSFKKVMKVTPSAYIDQNFTRFSS